METLRATRPDVRTLAAEVRSGRRSAFSLVSEHIEQIRHFDEGVHAIITSRLDEALVEAAAVDEVVRLGGDPGPLAGVPFTVKDAIATRDLPTSCGSRALAGRQTSTQAAAVTRLRAAGAILLAKTSLPEFAFGVTTHNELVGHTVNPTGPYAIGGSSGGEAAAVAAGMSAFGIGTDFGGSLRWPAECARLVGFRPGVLTVPGDGQLGVDPYGTSLQSRVQVIGPMTRTADDAALVFSVLTATVELAPADRALTEVTLHWDTTVAGTGPDDDVRAAVEDAALVMGGIGLQVSRGLPAAFDRAAELYDRLRHADPMRELHTLLQGREHLAGPGIRDLLRRAPQVDPDPQDQDQLAQIVAQLAQSVSAAELIMLPVGLHSPATVLRDGIDDFGLLTPCRVVSLFGLPALSLPCRTSGGPQSIQLVAQHGQEQLLFAVARAFQDKVFGIETGQVPW